MLYDVLIIGSGFGGLAAGAKLKKEGKSAHVRGKGILGLPFCGIIRMPLIRPEVTGNNKNIALITKNL